MTKLAYVVKNFDINGISNVIMNYIRNLYRDYEITVFAGAPINLDYVHELKSMNVNFVETPPKRGRNPFKYYSFLKKELKGFDLVHINGNSRTIVPELFISKINRNIKTIAHCHSTNTDFKILHVLLKPLFNRLYDLGLSCSNEAGKWMYGKKTFTIIPNGLEIDKYIYNTNKRNQIRKKLNISNDEYVIGHVGNFTRIKNYPFILEVFNRLLENDSNYKLLLVGNYDNNNDLKKMIEENYSNVIIYGSTNEVYDMYNAMDCFIFPSLYEGFGIVALEAQIAGLPCIISNNIPGEVKVSNRITNLGIKENDINNWCEQIVKYKEMNDRTINKDDYIKYDIKTNCEMLNGVYKALIK